MADYDHIIINMAHKDSLDTTQVLKSASTIRVAHAKYPDATLGICIDGYDDDPRELWEIPETIKFIQQFARASGAYDWRGSLFQKLDEESKGVLISCDAVRQPHPYKVEHNA